MKKVFSIVLAFLCSWKWWEHQIFLLLRLSSKWAAGFLSLPFSSLINTIFRCMKTCIFLGKCPRRCDRNKKKRKRSEHLYCENGVRQFISTKQITGNVLCERDSSHFISIGSQAYFRHHLEKSLDRSWILKSLKKRLVLFNEMPSIL